MLENVTRVQLIVVQTDSHTVAYQKGCGGKLESVLARGATVRLVDTVMLTDKFVACGVKRASVGKGSGFIEENVGLSNVSAVMGTGALHTVKLTVAEGDVFSVVAVIGTTLVLAVTKTTDVDPVFVCTNTDSIAVLWVEKTNAGLESGYIEGNVVHSSVFATVEVAPIALALDIAQSQTALAARRSMCVAMVMSSLLAPRLTGSKRRMAVAGIGQDLIFPVLVAVSRLAYTTGV